MLLPLLTLSAVLVAFSREVLHEPPKKKPKPKESTYKLVKVEDDKK